MPSPLASLLASSLVFPSFQVQETGVEGFGTDTVQPGANVPFEFTDLAGGFGVHQRSVIVDPKSMLPIAGSTARVRFRIDENIDGEQKVFWEDVLVSPGIAFVLARPQMGTVIEFGLGPYQTEIGVLARDTGLLHLRVFAPVTFNPVALSNTDQDDDKRIKYVFRAGAGAGADLTLGLGGVFLVGARTQGDYRWTHRAGEESLTHNRGDVEWILDAGLGMRTSTRTAIMATFFFQDTWQWTYDSAIDGIGRGNQVIGGRLSIRAYTEFEKPPEVPEEPPAPAPEPEPLGKPSPG
jgi:hypothetical protein